MIQDLDYTKRKKKRLPLNPIGETGLNLIRVADEQMNFNRATGNGEDEKEGNEEGKVEGGLTPSQQSYLDALEKTKTTAQERAGFLFDRPDKPEMDEDQRKRFKNLTKAGALAQLVDAVSDIAMGAGNKNYRPVPISGDDLAFSGLQEVYNMDQDFRNQMRNYEDQVFTIDQQNKQTEAKLNQQNENVDVQKAQDRLQFEANNEEVERLKKEAKYDQKSDEQKRYFDTGLRLISQGEEEAALAMLEKAGLETEEAKGLLGQDKGKDSTVINRLNRFMGYDGDKKSVSNLQMQMLKDYKKLRSQVDEEGYDVHFNEMTGDPRTGKGRDLLQMEKELGPLRFVPDDMMIEDVNKSATGTVGGDSDEESTDKGVDRAAIGKENEALIKQLVSGEKMSPEEVAPIAQKLYENGAKLGLSKEEVDDQLDEILDPESEFNQSQVEQIEIPGAEEPEGATIDTEEGQVQLQRYTAQVRDALSQAGDNQTKEAYLMKLGRVLESAGVGDEDITRTIELLLKGLSEGDSTDSEKEKPETEVNEEEASNTSVTPVSKGFLGRDLKKAKKKIGEFLTSTPSEILNKGN